jgi:[protein-PII] uridylyltransferase
MTPIAGAHTDILSALAQTRDELRQAHLDGMGGLALSQALSDAMDVALRSLWTRIGADEIALVALGGYGRGELSPKSDLDLMVLHDGSARAAEVSEALFYPLWDAGFVVGHATRKPKEALRLARDNLEAETSFLQPRLIAGAEGLFASFADAALAQTRKRADRFLADVQAMIRARHRAGGSATSQLEPDLKQGIGGLRDLHVLGWIERVFDPDQIPDHPRLHDQAEMLQRVRNHLHYITDVASDVLLLAHQRPTALFLGITDDERIAEDIFMRRLFAATRSVELVVHSLIADLAGRGAKHPRTDGPFAVAGGRVVVVDPPDVADEPERAVELFALGAPVGAAALDWLRRALEGIDPLPWTDRVRAAFIRLLKAADTQTLEAADHAGLFRRLLPGWDAVRCQPQHNVYHGYTVDAHLFNTVLVARDLDTSTDPLVLEVVADVGATDTLLLAALLHDIGKGTDEDHALRGERMALLITERMGIDRHRRSIIAWLVRHHLLLVEAATRRDLNDENFIVEVAARIGDAERLRLLFLLSVADGIATGPSAWSSWKAGLVTELFIKAMHVIERGELVTSDANQLVRLRTAELRAGLSRYPEAQVDAHIAGMSRAYMLAFPVQTLIRHFALMADHVGELAARGHVAPTDEQGVYEYTIVARDRPGLFARVSGALSLQGINITSAQGYTRTDGLALEVFRCVGAFEEAPDEARWRRVTEDVQRAMRGRLSIEARLGEKREAYTRAAKTRPAAPKVILDNSASDFLTVVEVHAPDRIGLLYDICAALAELALDIQVAKVATYGEDVVDVFYVRDADGQKVADAEHVAEIERAILYRLGA